MNECDLECEGLVGTCRHGVVRDIWQTPDIKFFGPGERWWGNSEGQRIEIPVGAICISCDEEVGPEDKGVAMATMGLMDVKAFIPGHPNFVAQHQECMWRSLFGSLDCQKRGEHTRGSCEDVPTGMTKRQAAKAAMDYALRKRRIHVVHEDEPN